MTLRNNNSTEGFVATSLLSVRCLACDVKSVVWKAARKFIEYMLDESGYAMDRDRISSVKTDPCPSVYGEMGNVVMLSGNAFNNETYNYYIKLVSEVDPSSASEIRNIIDA